MTPYDEWPLSDHQNHNNSSPLLIDEPIIVPYTSIPYLFQSPLKGLLQATMLLVIIAAGSHPYLWLQENAAYIVYTFLKFILLDDGIDILTLSRSNH